jgi:hypothetical protein
MGISRLSQVEVEVEVEKLQVEAEVEVEKTLYHSTLICFYST